MSGKTSNESKAKYNAKAYDRIEIIVKKGNKAVINEAAEANGKSVNKFINEAIGDKMKLEGKSYAQED